MVAPVVAVGVDVVAADEVVAGFADDGDGLSGYEDQDRGVGVFAADAEAPEAWECRTCGAEAALVVDNEAVTIDHSDDKTPRTHWDMLLERRTIPELEELLEERLAYVRARRGAGGESTDKLSA